MWTAFREIRVTDGNRETFEKFHRNNNKQRQTKTMKIEKEEKRNGIKYHSIDTYWCWMLCKCTLKVICWTISIKLFDYTITYNIVRSTSYRYQRTRATYLRMHNEFRLIECLRHGNSLKFTHNLMRTEVNVIWYHDAEEILGHQLNSKVFWMHGPTKAFYYRYYMQKEMKRKTSFRSQSKSNFMDQKWFKWKKNVCI